MNAFARLRAVTLLSAASLLAACSTSPISRIDANREVYESWPIEIQEAVLNGSVKPGMTPEMVRVAIGKPSEVVVRSVKAGEDEIWVYRSGGGGLLGNTGIAMGGSVGTGGVSVGSSSSTGTSQSSSEEKEVVFRNGVVSRSDFP